ncbi:MAG TPA: trypsin-like serine protease [Mycobacteriales bacterium]|nr:trypsin-like serine protease [Mycobacteriales bacterium]
MRKAIYALTAATLALGAAASTQAQAAGELIQPGVYSESSVGGCTFNFVYDGVGAQAGKTYIGTAAHCVAEVGDQVTLGSGELVGTVAHLGDENSTALDYAFVEVRSELLSRVRAAVKGYPSYPKGMTSPQDTALGDTIQLSGYGVGYGATALTQEKRIAVMGYDDAAIHDVAGPIHFGDSGGPLVHAKSGKALGIVSRLCFGVCSEEGPTVAGLIAAAAENGFTVQLRTV